MTALPEDILLALIEGSAEPVLLARTDDPDWPVVLSNGAFDAISEATPVAGQPFADILGGLVGRDLAQDISSAVRSGEILSLPVETAGREYLLILNPIVAGKNQRSTYCAAYWRGGTDGAVPGANNDTQQALAKARRRIRDLSREDPVTGLLNEKAFWEVLAHDWAVAAREESALALVCFSLDDFDAYLEVFGRHGTDSCLRRVSQALRRCLRRASDVAARIDDDKLIVLSHGSPESAVREFAQTIAATVLDQGLHHPRSKVSRYVTVSFTIVSRDAGTAKRGAKEFLSRVLAAS